MKKILLFMFCLLAANASLACSMAMTYYYGHTLTLEQWQDPARAAYRGVEIYKEFDNNPKMEVFYRKGDQLYLEGKPFRKIDPASYRYLGSGYYRDRNELFFFGHKVASVKRSDVIKTYRQPVSNRSPSSRAAPPTQPDVAPSPCGDGGRWPTEYYLDLNGTVYRAVEMNGVPAQVQP